ncbi:MAG: CsgG/HfaB family protein [Rubrivivax sp.]|nr:CsgG/HfaB family protein [Rubrivivax sp.]
MNVLSAPAPAPAGALHRVRRWLLAGLLSTGSLAASAQAAALPAVVVWDFDNQTAMSTLPAERTDYLRRSLSENLTATLLQVPGLRVVERQRLKDLLAEQRLSAGALADEDTRLRLGKIVGAQRMVFGGFFVLGDEVQVHVRVIDTASSRVVFSDEASTPLPAVMQQVAAMNGRLARALGGNTAASLRSHPPALWQAYDRALALADAGQIDAAVQSLQELLARDKDFTPAERQLVALLDKMARR